MFCFASAKSGSDVDALKRMRIAAMKILKVAKRKPDGKTSGKLFAMLIWKMKQRRQPNTNRNERNVLKSDKK